MSVKPCNIRIPSGLSDAQVAADAACAAKRYAYSAEQVESRLNSYVDDLTGLDLEQIAANTAAAAEVVERTEAAAATAQYSAAIVEDLAPQVQDMLDAVIRLDLKQLREDIEDATVLLDTVETTAGEVEQSRIEVLGAAERADQSETAAEEALAETWTAYSAVLTEKEGAADYFSAEAEGKVAAAVEAQLSEGGALYEALDTAVTSTIPSTVKANADAYVTQLTTNGGSLYDYVEDSKTEIRSLQGGAVSTITTHRNAAIYSITTAEGEAIASIGSKVDADIAEKINPEYISEKVNAELPRLIAEELADADGDWNTAKNDAIADAKEQAELARQWATSNTTVAGTSYMGAYGYALLAERQADDAAQSKSSAIEAANRAAESEANVEEAKSNVAVGVSVASNAATSANTSATSAATSAARADSMQKLAQKYQLMAEAFAINDNADGFDIINNGNGPEVVPGSGGQSYRSAKSYASKAQYSAAAADISANTARKFAISEGGFRYFPDGESYSIATVSARTWADSARVFTYSYKGESDTSYGTVHAASARMWAEAESPINLNGEAHKSARAYAIAAQNAEAEALYQAEQANAAASYASESYNSVVEAYGNVLNVYSHTLDAYSHTLEAYSITKAAVAAAETYLTAVNAVKSDIDQTLIASNWTANNIAVDKDTGTFTVTPGLVYAVWSKEVCAIYKDAALENKLCTIWAEEQRCILATQAEYYISPIEQAAAAIITSVQYTQPSA